MADIKTKFIFVKNGYVSAITFPGEPVNNTYGDAAGEVPFETVVGVGDAWPLADAAPAKKTTKKAAASTDATADTTTADAAPDAPAA